MKIAVEQLTNTLTNPIGSYGPTKWNIGTLIKQYSGVSPEQNFIGPVVPNPARPMEESTPVAMMYPHAITWSSIIDWVFLVENSTAAVATKRVFLYEYNKSTSQYSWKGFITLTLPTATVHTTRGFRCPRYTYSNGTVGVSGTAVTGSSTTFQTSRIGAGARIGFGSTDPTQITTWYYISAIGSDTSITLTTSAGTIASGTSYVIEELRPMLVTTNATLANGGLFVAKGINFNDFTPSGTTIAVSAAGTDNLKLVYKLSDAATTTLTVGGGLAIDDPISNTEHYVYIINGTTTVSVFKMNVRSNDTITTGQMVLTGTNLVITGTQAVTGTTSQVNNSRICTTSHGPGSGVKSLYFVTTTRIYRAALSNITSGNITWQSDNRAEVGPEGSNTFAVTSALSSIEYIDSIDSFIVLSTFASAVRSYITKYPTNSGDPFNYVWGLDTKLSESPLSSSLRPLVPATTAGTTGSIWSENGVAHYVKNGLSSVTNTMFNIPFAAHWDFTSTTNQRLISPELSTPNNNKFLRVYVSDARSLGSSMLQTSTETFKLYYRTTGISDNSGTWNLVNKRGDLDISGTSSIQFMIEFLTIGIGFLIPARIYGLTVLYEDLSTDSHYLPSADLSNKTTKTFAWKFQTAFGGTVPTLRIRLYNAITNGLLDDDNSITQTGTWEKSTDGITWGFYNTSDKTNETTFIRFTPASIPDNIQVRALLTQL